MKVKAINYLPECFARTVLIALAVAIYWLIADDCSFYTNSKNYCYNYEINLELCRGDSLAIGVNLGIKPLINLGFSKRLDPPLSTPLGATWGNPQDPLG